MNTFNIVSSGYPGQKSQLWSYPNMITQQKSKPQLPSSILEIIRKNTEHRMSGRSYFFHGTTFTGNRSVGDFTLLKQMLGGCSRRYILRAACASWGATSSAKSKMIQMIQNVSDLGKSVKNILRCNCPGWNYQDRPPNCLYWRGTVTEAHT